MENSNPVPLQRILKLQYGDPSKFEDLFERKDISKKFYQEFNRQKIALGNSIHGITNPEDKKLYAQILLDRLIFLFFLQSKNLLNENPRYFAEKYREYSQKKNAFYETFLKELFFNALCRKERENTTLEIVGKSIPYLNGGLFLKHELEEKYPKIQVANETFAEIFRFFESWNWNVNERSETDEDSIDPYILGYIFENTLVDNKSGGVYYTPASLSEFLTDETIEGHLFTNLKSASGPYKDTLEFIEKATEKELFFFYETLRTITICDPACGSGQFLVQALHSLSFYHSRFVQRIQKEGWEELKTYVQKDYSIEKDPTYGIRRHIAAKNLYGVDILPEAAEITKLRLFLAMVEGIGNASETLEPLPNIDFHIRSGNSLTGFLFLPEDFFKALSATRAKGKKNSAEERILDFGDAESKMLKKDKLVTLYTNEPSPEEALKLRKEIREIDLELQNVLNQRLEQKMSEWKVRPKKKIDFIDEKKDLKAKEILNRFVLKTEEIKPFHHGMEFSTILHPSNPNLPGFDIVLMNPPWDVLQPDSKEYFEKHIKDVRGFDKNVAKIKIPDILKSNPSLKQAWIQFNLEISSYSDLINKSNFFPNSKGGKINLYKLFLERGWNLLKEGGSLGIVIPAGLYSDLGSKDLRKMLFQEGKIHFLYGFENRKQLFENVDSRFKFILLSATKQTDSPASSVPAAFMLHTESDLHSVHENNRKKQESTLEVSKSDPSADRRFLDLPIELITRLSPDSLSLMEFKSDTDIHIVEKMAKFPRLGEELEGTWNVKLSSEFNMTTDSYLFFTQEVLKKKGAQYDPETMIWKNGKEEWWPLYEGRMVTQYDHRAASYVSGSQRSAVWNYLNFPKLSNVNPHYWIIPQEKNKVGYKIYICDVTGSSNKRTGLATVVKRNESSGNSLAIIDTDNLQINLLLTGLINSFSLDFYVRLRIPGNHYNQAVIFDLPTPRYLNEDSKLQKEKHTQGSQQYFAFRNDLIQTTARLVGTTPAFDELLQEVFGPKANHKTHGVTDPAQRQILKNQIDAMVAKIYGLEEAELKHILSTFPLVEEEIKEGVLEEWRKLK
ncbi:Eco57I restriction-modification methylase [Leptospira interrogans serovar Zanoni str. LT2156]|uniref:site-specific DNA-methyltransferase (adenine-specific) n=1 Tax=Leptospira interrogans serovar Zanoni str. LT2156 TaxID=1001601 RepID=M6HQU1_LEPIR|nr:Eco57I restriction-modification methylase [Leptospira interrogans serovar Zanoni str. LT2156]